MTPKAAPWLLLSLSAVVCVVVVLLFFGSGSILHFLRKLTVHYAIEWGICGVVFTAAAAQAVWDKVQHQQEQRQQPECPSGKVSWC